MPEASRNGRLVGAECRPHIDGSDTWAYWVVFSVGFVGFAVLCGASAAAQDAWFVQKPMIDGVPPDQYEIQIWPQSDGPVRWPPRVHFDPAGLKRYAKM
jgi:hypothetical protein